VLAIYWIVLAGSKTGTTAHSSVAFVVFSTLNFGFFARFGLVDDEATYFRYGATLANSLLTETGEVSSGFTSGKESYVWILALLMVLFGQSPLPGLALGVLLMVMLPAIIVSAGRNFGILSSGALTAWLVVLSPPILFWGHGLNREPLVFFLLVCLLLSFSWITQGRWVMGVVGVALVGIAMSSTRSSLLAVVTSGAVAFAFLRLLDSMRRAGLAGGWSTQRGLTVLGLALGALFLPAVWIGLIVTDSPSWRALGVGIPELSGMEQATALVGATWTYNSSLGGFSYNVVRSLIGPLPWEVSNLSLAVFAVEGMGYLVFFSAILLGAMAVDRVRDIGLALGVTVLPLVVAASLLLANYGLNSRIRAHIFLLLLILVEPIAVRLLKTRRRPSFENRSPQLRLSRSRVTGRNL
jgi:hypothetical protein